MLAFLQKHVGLVFCVALAAGVFFPTEVPGITDWLKPLMGFLLFVSFLNVDVAQMKSDVSRPLWLAIQILLSFIVVPVALFFVLRGVGLPHFAVAAMLLAAMPAGLGGPVLTSLAGGRISTSVVLSVLTHIMVPLSVPFLFWAFTDMTVQVDIAGMAKQLALLVCIPMLCAWIARTYAGKAVAGTKPYHKVLSILALAAVAYIVIVPYADTVRADAWAIVPALLGTYLLFTVLGLSALVFSRGRPPEEQAAVVISRIYMNNALAIVLAAQFFGKEVTIITILAEIPWFTTFGVYLWFQHRYMNLKHVH